MTEKRKISGFDLVVAAYAAVLAILLGISKLKPQLGFFHLTIGGQSVCLLLLSGWTWLFLVWIFRRVQNLCGVRFTRQNRIALFTAIAITAAYYAYSLLTRRFAYYWDFAFYYRNQLGLMGDFGESGFITPVLNVIGSVWYEEYSAFNCIFIAAPFAFVPHTENWFIACSALSILPPLYWAFAIVVKQIERAVRPAHGAFFFGGSMLVFAGLPLLHRALLYGQPDLFGLILVFLIVGLTLFYDFSETQIVRYLLIVVLTIMTCASRRWYMFWLLGFYICYSIVVIVSALLKKRRGNIVRLLLFGVCAAAVVSAVLFPMFKRILSTDYANAYAVYNDGGFPVELKSQAGYLGVGLVLLMAAGGIWALFQKNLRRAGILAISSGFTILFLFTRIQNMGFHHSLIMVPSYALLLVFCVLWISTLEKKAVFACAAAAALGFSAVNTTVCAAVYSGAMPAPFSQLSLKLPKRSDFEQIEQVNQWLREHCDQTNYAYMIPHGTPYNPDVFRCFDLPDDSVIQILQYGSAALGTHAFPVGLLEAKYVLTCNPFCDFSLAGKYNSAFFSEIPQKHFIEVERFDMGNGYVFTAYQRILKTDAEEITFYKDCFAEEDALFPNLFSGVLDAVLNGLNSSGS